MMTQSRLAILHTQSWIKVAPLVTWSVRHVLIGVDGEPDILLTTMPDGTNFAEVLEPAPGVH